MPRQMQLGALGATDEIRDDMPEQSYPEKIVNKAHPLRYNARAFARQNELLAELRRYGIPIINEESGYESMMITLPDGQDYSVTRINPRFGDRTDLGVVSRSRVELNPPAGEWVHVLRRA